MNGKDGEVEKREEERRRRKIEEDDEDGRIERERERERERETREARKELRSTEARTAEVKRNVNGRKSGGHRWMKKQKDIDDGG